MFGLFEIDASSPRRRRNLARNFDPAASPGTTRPVPRPDALDEGRDLVGVSDECRADHLCDNGMVRVALGTDDDAFGHGWRW
jgi:hypothetical protein